MAVHFYINLINRLQRVQDCPSRLVTGTRKRDPITPVFVQLPRLPIRSRSMYTILFHAPKAPSWAASLYLIRNYISVKLLRPESCSLLWIPKKKSHTAMYGDKSFRASAGRAWIKLQSHIKLAPNKEIVCKLPKTNLFKLTYLWYVSVSVFIDRICLGHCNAP